MLTSLLLAASLTDTVRMMAKPACQDCHVVENRIAVLSAADGVLLDYGAFSFVRIKDGRFLTTGFARDGTIGVFGPDGRWQRDLGRRGAGPGEYGTPARLSLWTGDSVLVLDVALSRVSVLGPDLRFARSFPLTLPQTRLVGLPDGKIALSSPPGSERGIMVVNRAGRTIATFGPRTMANSLDFQRELARGQGGTVLTARADRYDIEEFTSRGASRRLTRRTVEWFPPADSRRQVSALVEPTPPATAGILSAGDGMMWHLTAVTRVPFMPPVIRGPDGKDVYDLGTFLAQKDTRVELLDLRSRQVVASALVVGLLWPGDTFPLAAKIRDDTSRGPTVEIVELKVERP